ncbi:MAG: hypothetical protein O3B84_02550 [Chloroflexi bacterium]|nr:hypothetical protein [Chloroflexota bacterium]
MSHPHLHLLRQVARPARYAGGEWNSIRKLWESVALRVCLAYPDTYDVAALRPSLNSLYQTLNRNPAIAAERVFAPLPDFAAALRAEATPLFSLESQRPLEAFDVLAIAIPHELAAPTVLEILDIARLPLLASERGERHPLVIGWEERPLNPEPLTPFFDAYLVGDPEVAFEGVARSWEETRMMPGGQPNRLSLLASLAKKVGIYVPSLHFPAEAAMDGGERERAAPIRRAIWRGLMPAPSRQLVPHLQVTPDLPTVEVQRGWLGGGLFVGDGPLDEGTPGFLRQRPWEAVVEAVRETLVSTGFDEVALGAPHLSSYPDLNELLAAVAGICTEMSVHLRLPPIAVDMVTREFFRALGEAKPNVTIGPVSAGMTLRRTVDAEEAHGRVLEALSDATARNRIGNLRLEVILGHGDDDVEDAAQKTAEFIRSIRRVVNPRTQTRVMPAFHVPRPFTALERQGQLPSRELYRSETAFRTALGRKGNLVPGRSVTMSQVEAALARGGREMSRVVHRAWSTGCLLDGSNEFAQPELWKAAFAEEGLDLEACATQSFSLATPLSWRHLDGRMNRPPERSLP